MNYLDTRMVVQAGCCKECGRPLECTLEKLGIIVGLRSVQIGEAQMRISVREQQLLETLLRAYPEPTSREHIFERVWGFDSDALDKIIDVFACRLRKLLRPHGFTIKNVRSVGYKLEKYVA